MILPGTDELPVTTPYGRWMWCVDHEDGWFGYLHMDCDCACNDDGFCMACHSPSPAVITLTCQACGESPCDCFNGRRLRKEEY